MMMVRRRIIVVRIVVIVIITVVILICSTLGSLLQPSCGESTPQFLASDKFSEVKRPEDGPGTAAPFS